jgi:hypothetical protein
MHCHGSLARCRGWQRPRLSRQRRGSGAS